MSSNIGKLFRISPEGKVELHFKSKESNLLSLLAAPGGALYCGSGEKGLPLERPRA